MEDENWVELEEEEKVEEKKAETVVLAQTKVEPGCWDAFLIFFCMKPSKFD
jgi:hypothetical protein